VLGRFSCENRAVTGSIIAIATAESKTNRRDILPLVITVWQVIGSAGTAHYTCAT
jgi:hypothetical protein